MKKFLICLLFASANICAQSNSTSDDRMILSEQSKKLFKKENKTAQQAISNDLTRQEYHQVENHNREKARGEVAKASQNGSSDIMIVDPIVVSKDWTDAFNALSSKKQSNLTFVLRDQTTISQVSSIEPMPGGYLMLFTIRTVQGTKYQIVKTGDIQSLEAR